jgi:hypothetical protein
MLIRNFFCWSMTICMLFILAASTPSAAAATIWTDWTSASSGAPGSATGTVGGVGVSYAGELAGFVINGGSNIWNPESSFVGGTVTDSPDAIGDDLRLIGNTGLTNTITFSTPVENPVFAIWSLGQPGVMASFTFGLTPTLQAGGPNANFGGSSISIAGNVVSGFEGNGVVQFNGTVSSISWTNTPENFYAFTVGVNGDIVNPIPEPSTILLTVAGAGLLLLCRSVKRSMVR